MPRRHQSRECALQILYAIDAGGLDARTALSGFWDDFGKEEGVREYTETLVNGVACNLAAIDQELEKRSINWRMSRMSLVDRNILRLAAYEMLFGEDVPGKVSIDEAIELAKRFGSEDSRAFVNGILDGVFTDVRNRP
ncbi:MAG: transcription antitermination factor NusB [Myxococcota bacterium]|jgi:N utilization substance protein B